jgi:hypothetical protein
MAMLPSRTIDSKSLIILQLGINMLGKRALKIVK